MMVEAELLKGDHRKDRVLTVDKDSPLSQITVLSERTGGMLEAMVPADLIYREDVPVDQGHVDELIASIEAESAKGGSTGQLSPILLGEITGRATFPIIDGFHRDAALHSLGKPEIFATIRPNCTPEEVLDLRILTATTHSSVSFARVVEWIGDAWQKSPWAEQLTVTQAFGLTKTRSSGSGLGLTAEQTKEVKRWTNDKCEKWRMSAGTIYSNLTTAEAADPDLVKEVRPRKSGNSLEAMTPQHLEVIVKYLPMRYAEQWLVVGVARFNNFNVPTTRAVAKEFGATGSIEEARALAETRDWSRTSPVYDKPRKERSDRTTTGEINPIKLSRELLLTELKLARLSLDNTVLRGRYTPPSPQTAMPDHRLSIDYTGDEQIVGLLTPLSSDLTIETFLRRVESVESKAIQALIGMIGNTGMTEQAARRLINVAAGRIVEDMNSGALRFVDIEKPYTLDDLLHNCLRSELGQAANAPGTMPLTAIKTEQELVTVNLDSILKMFPNLKDTFRRVLVLHGFLNLHPDVIAQILKTSSVASESLVSNVHTAVAKAALMYENL